MKKGILLVAALLLTLCSVGITQAEDLSGALNVNYATRYIWRGFDLFPNNDGVFQPSVDLNLFDTGFGVHALWAIPDSSGHEEMEWAIGTLDYSNVLMRDEACQINYTVGWSFYNFLNRDSSNNFEEVFGAFSFPNMLGVPRLVPSYTVIKLWTAESGSPLAENVNGWLHVIGLDYGIPVVCPFTGKDIVLNLSASTVYNDQISLGGDTTSDWSHAVYGISTGLPIAENMILTPAAYYQTSWENVVNTSDEYWASLMLSYLF